MSFEFRKVHNDTKLASRGLSQSVKLNVQERLKVSIEVSNCLDNYMLSSVSLKP